ncbi:MAG: SUMF1/EgtB/PvdO family nonheme iron enzyme [Magnetococcales bacterium]|nr:SUMF1/EgtB/PvdO family nonheme iron enzyme [Magnetococcales bacterium]
MNTTQTFPAAQPDNFPKKYVAGERLGSGRYEIVKKVGEGNFALIYQVRELASGRLFAMKQATVARKPYLYRSEVKMLTILRDGPHILPLHESWLDEDGAMIIITDYLDGGNLKQAIVDRGCLKESEALSVLGQMVQAVAHAHHSTPPIIHRDIKPSNIIGKRTGTDRMSWYLADWGLACEWHRAREPAVSGTHSYTAPEVWRKRRYLVSDVYSLGMTLYFMLFGRPAYEGGSETIGKHQKNVNPVNIPDSCPKPLKTLLAGMLAKNPKKRWTLDQVQEVVLPQGKKRKATLLLRSRLPAGKGWTIAEAGVELTFNWVPGGTFLMGQSAAEQETIIQTFGEEDYTTSFQRETPRHPVKLNGFWICRTPITRASFSRFQQKTGYQTLAQREGWFRVWNPAKGRLERREGEGWMAPGFHQEEDHPVVNVTYADCLAMAEWLSQRCHRFIQLPSEAQWERACRGGSETPFSFGEQILSDQANFNGLKPSPFSQPGLFRAGTTPVEHFSHAANPYGLLDMHGNVFEWTRDWYEPNFYHTSPTENPRSVWSKQGERVLRGGSWLSPSLRTRSAYRDSFAPDERDADVGFRLVGLAYPWEQ